MMPRHIGSLTLYDVEELAGLLQVHEVTIRKLLKAGKLPGRKLAKRWYVSEDALKAYFQEPEPLDGLEDDEEEPEADAG